jgi:glycosyltransferase involved in cell wall biosynthesis
MLLLFRLACFIAPKSDFPHAEPSLLDMHPEITIGLAVFNGEKSIAAAIDSLLAQKFTNWRLLISDNCSTDNTGAVCTRYAAMDKRIQYSRRTQNLGIAENYRHLLADADTPYFMWAAADDLWAPGFLLLHHKFLEEHPDYVLSQSKVLFWCEGIPSRMALGTYPMRASPKVNGARFFAKPADNSRFYGLIRTKPLQQAFPERIFYGFDWLISGGTLKFGKHNEIPEIMMVRDETPATDYQAGVTRYADSLLFRVFPLLPLAMHVLKYKTVPGSLSLAWSLLRTNLRISLRFATFKLHSAVSSSEESTKAHGGVMREVKRQVARLLAPGMSERLVTRMQSINRAIRERTAHGLSGASKGSNRPASGTQLAGYIAVQKTFGWRAPRAIGAVRPQVSVLVAANDQLGNLLTLLDGMDTIAEDLPFEVVVLDNASLDATSVVLKDRPDVRLISKKSPLPLGLLLNELAQAAQADRLVFLHPQVFVNANAIMTLAQSIDRAELSLAVSIREDAKAASDKPLPCAFGISRKAWVASGGVGADLRLFSEAAASLEEHVVKAGGRVLVNEQSEISPYIAVPPADGVAP